MRLGPGVADGADGFRFTYCLQPRRLRRTREALKQVLLRIRKSLRTCIERQLTGEARA